MEIITNKTIKDLKCGSTLAFDKIYKAYFKEIYRLSFTYVGNSFEADDCVQDIFVKLLEKIDLYDDTKGNFHAWFKVFAKNFLINNYHSKKLFSERFVFSDELLEACSIKPSGENKVLLEEVEEVVGKDSYYILQCRLGFSMTFEDIAKEVKSSRETVRLKYNNALKIIKEFYK